MYYIDRLLLRSQKVVASNQCMKLWDALIYRHKTNALPFLMNALTSSFPQSMIARLVLNLLKSRDTIAVLQRSIAFDAFPLWHSRMFFWMYKNSKSLMWQIQTVFFWWLVLACNAFYFNLPYNRFAHITFYSQSKRLLLTIIHCSLYTSVVQTVARKALWSGPWTNFHWKENNTLII